MDRWTNDLDTTRTHHHHPKRTTPPTTPTQVDNFYLDMNGIIHMCTHANAEELILLDERKMFQRIFTYTDRLYKIVAPTRAMFLAIDGVAPRAKMNQQRARRFRSSKDQEALMAEMVAAGMEILDDSDRCVRARVYACVVLLCLSWLVGVGREW